MLDDIKYSLEYFIFVRVRRESKCAAALPPPGVFQNIDLEWFIFDEN